MILLKQDEECMKVFADEFEYSRTGLVSFLCWDGLETMESV